MPLATVYHTPSFFSPLPRAVWGLVERGQLARRDASLLGVLLDYKGRQGAIVGPGQATLARRLACSIDTIQRSLCRLVQAGLIDKLPQRSRDGRKRGLHYDLSKTLGLMPGKAAKMRSGQWGAEAGESDRSSEADAQTTRPQKCGVEVESDIVEADNNAPTAPHGPGPEKETGDAARLTVDEAVVAALRAAGVWRAERLVERYGAARCRQALAAAPRRTRTSRAGWVVACLLGGWDLPRAHATASVGRAQTNLSPAPHSQGGAERPGLTSSPPDLLQALSGDDFLALEIRARAELIRESGPPIKEYLRQGKCTAIVHRRMRELMGTSEMGQEARP